MSRSFLLSNGRFSFRAYMKEPGGDSGAATEVSDESSDTDCFPLFVTAATGILALKSDASNLTYNSSTGLFTAVTLGGTLTTAAQANITSLGSLTGLTTAGLTTTGDITLTDVNLVLTAVTGTQIGTATTQLLGFWGATPVDQPSAYTQTYSTADKTHANMTSNDLTLGVGANGYASAAEAESVETELNALRADVIDLKKPCEFSD